ncbi:TPA: homoserine O-succinyltransferase, partial [Candidatus Woesearchaeota archaeon]|nr:homoserine O-succinyltransferase [Candidatus Woesearchaeota archaeon]
LPTTHHYLQDNDPGKHPLVRWNSHSSLLFSNWINYYVYQLTPYRLEDIA